MREGQKWGHLMGQLLSCTLPFRYLTRHALHPSLKVQLLIAYDQIWQYSGVAVGLILPCTVRFRCLIRHALPHSPALRPATAVDTVPELNVRSSSFLCICR